MAVVTWQQMHREPVEESEEGSATLRRFRVRPNDMDFCSVEINGHRCQEFISLEESCRRPPGQPDDTP
jgi:hypothetical protein